jgi:hypothetical protein
MYLEKHCQVVARRVRTIDACARIKTGQSTGGRSSWTLALKYVSLVAYQPEIAITPPEIHTLATCKNCGKVFKATFIDSHVRLMYGQRSRTDSQRRCGE